MSGVASGLAAGVTLRSLMKSDSGDLGAEYPVIHNTSLQACGGFEQTRDLPADTLSLRTLLDSQILWWETGWFQEWERVARAGK